MCTGARRWRQGWQTKIPSIQGAGTAQEGELFESGNQQSFARCMLITNKSSAAHPSGLPPRPLHLRKHVDGNHVEYK